MSIGSWGESQLRDAAGSFFGSDYLRDYTHASKTFRPNSYENSPKFKFLFHVYFDINPEAYQHDRANFSLLVKSIRLPSFNFDVHTMNQYNRKRLVQTKIKYEPIDVSFHDDCGNLASSLWYKYYTYYFSDALNPKVVLGGKQKGTIGDEAAYNTRNTYADSITGAANWGFTGESASDNGAKIPFFKNITVFGMNRHKFVAYTLVNPVITRFAHDQYNYAEAAGVMENNMTIDYETVVYNQGEIDGRTPDTIITGFGTGENYDRTVSPIAVPGSNGNILGNNGLVDGAGGFVSALSSGQIGLAAKLAGTTYNTAKRINLLDTAKSEVENMLYAKLGGSSSSNRNKQWDIPSFDSTPPTGSANTVTNSTGVNNNAGSQQV